MMNGEKILTLKQHKETGLFYRENTGDLESIKDCLRNYRHLVLDKEDVVLDLGANIGGFTYINSPKCKQIIAIEASRSNFEVLTKNVGALDNIVLYNGAIVNDEFTEDMIKFVTTQTKISSLSGKILQKDKPRKGQICEEIKAYRISEIIQKYSPTIVKIDVEGA
jgi:FkbM family methyltransferase